MKKKLLYVLRGVGLTLLALFLFVIGPCVWPIYLGILILRPYIFFRVLGTRIW